MNPITALFWTAVLNGFAAPPLLWLILVISNDRKLMADRTNNRLTNLLGVATALSMSVLAIVWVVLLLTGQAGVT